MKLGVVFPQTEIEAAAIKDYIITAEELGYDYVLAYEHVIGANPKRPGGWHGPYTHQSQFHEPFVTFSYMAALTKHIEFVTGILILPQRQTVLVAKQAAQLDVLSNGRVRLGIGVGWNAVEFEALNEDFTNRGRRSEEQVAVLRELWKKPLVGFKGKYHTISDAGLNPMPVQQPIPIWFGGGADIVLRRMAQLGDGWMPNTMPFDRTQAVLEKLRGYLVEAGREPSTFGVDIRINLKQHPQDEWPSIVEQWRDLGVSHLCINTMGANFDAQEHITAVRQFKETVG